MIGLDSYSRQVFIYLDPILIYISLWIRLPIWNSQNCSMFPLAFVAGWLQGHWWGFISRNYVVWPTFFLMNVFIALKGSHLWFYILSRSRKKQIELTHFSIKNTCNTITTKRMSKSIQTFAASCAAGYFVCIKQNLWWTDRDADDAFLHQKYM